MTVLKCKMCGAPLEIKEGDKLAQCRYCDSMQTLPDTNDDLKLKLFNRATELRLVCDFDQASSVFQSIIAQFPEEAEAYWGLVLCKYGIEYVDDPRDGKKVPTCHRTRRQAIADDFDFQAACRYADTATWKYEEDAAVIHELQQKILRISQSETSCDVFICYKETDDVTKHRTEDSITAQDIYTELSKQYNVFFARVSLREKAGTEYEPYIYAALSTAKVMLVLGSQADYFNAVWVKNEWSRYLEMLTDDKRLIPCYESITPAQLPRQLQGFQALDMSNKLFFTNLMTIIHDTIASDTAAPRAAQLKEQIAVKKATQAETSKREESIMNKPTIQKLPLKNGTYIGEVLNGQPHGHGVNHYDNGGKFEGTWKNGVNDGECLYTYPTGETLTSVWKDGKTIRMYGTVFGYNNGEKYIGEMNGNSEKHGQGTYTYAKGQSWTGEWKDGKRWNGSGYTQYYSFGKPIGGYHIGATVNGQYHGEGEEKVGRDGTLFKGSWVNGVRHGKGTLIYCGEEKTWVGEWKDGVQWKGHGIMLYRREDKYTGEEYNGDWDNGQRHGRGVNTFANGNRYEGEWQNDKKSGQGTLTYPDGTTWIGEWKDDRAWNGNGTIWHCQVGESTTRFQGELRDGQFYKGKLYDAAGKVCAVFSKGKEKHGIFGLF